MHHRHKEMVGDRSISAITRRSIASLQLCTLKKSGSVIQRRSHTTVPSVDSPKCIELKRISAHAFLQPCSDLQFSLIALNPSTQLIRAESELMPNLQQITRHHQSGISREMLRLICLSAERQRSGQFQALAMAAAMNNIWCRHSRSGGLDKACQYQGYK